MKSLAAGIARAGSTDTESSLTLPRPQGRRPLRAVCFPRQRPSVDAGAFVGKIALKNGHGTMVDFKYVDGASALPSDAEVKKLRSASD